MSDPSKTLDALQSLVVQPRAADHPLSAIEARAGMNHLRVALEAAENVVATPHGARIDHLRRVEARGPGPKLVPLGPYHVELVRYDLLDPPERIRVWRQGHIVAEVEIRAS